MTMMRKLFAYGTLKDAQVQMKIIGRVIKGTLDVLLGYKKESITLAKGTYPALVPKENGRIEGFVLEVSDEELKKLDEYETNAYKRVVEKLESGEEGFVYILNS